MRAIWTFATLASLLLPCLAQAGQTCDLPLDKVIRTAPYLTSSMQVHDAGANSITLENKDDPRIVANFAFEIPLGSDGYSKSDYMHTYETAAAGYTATLKDDKSAETSFFPYEPLAWRVVETTNLADVGKALEGHMYIRLTEHCLLKSTFISPYSENLLTRWHDLTSAISDLRTTAQPFVQTTMWEREDTSPKGGLAILIGFVAPMFVVGFLYHTLRHFSRLDAPSRSTRVVVGSMMAMTLGLAWHQHAGYMTNFALLKYTDSLMMLASCFLIAAVSLAFAQRTTVLSLITGAVTGVSLVASAALGWTPDAPSTGAVGLSLFIVGVLGFYAWSHTFEKTAQ